MGNPIPAASVVNAVIAVEGQRRRQTFERDLYEGTQHEFDQSTGPHFCLQWPLSLLRSAAARRPDSPRQNHKLLRHVMAYAIDQRAKFLNMEPDVVECAELSLDFPLDNFGVIVREAQTQVDTYRTAYAEQSGKTSLPYARVHWQVLQDTFNGDLCLRDFLVYCAVTSKMNMRRGKKQVRKPVYMTVSEILRRMHGFHNADMYRAAVASENFKLTYTRAQVRRAIKQLVKVKLLYKATVKRQTYYATRAVLYEAGIRSLHAWVKGLQDARANAWRATVQLDREYSGGHPAPATYTAPAPTYPVRNILAAVGIQAPAADPVSYVPRASPVYSTGGDPLLQCDGCGHQHRMSEPCKLEDFEAHKRE